MAKKMAKKTANSDTASPCAELLTQRLTVHGPSAWMLRTLED
jgi:hypothetical protein